jgi:hypothetical protein
MCNTNVSLPTYGSLCQRSRQLLYPIGTIALVQLSLASLNTSFCISTCTSHGCTNPFTSWFLEESLMRGSRIIQAAHVPQRPGSSWHRADGSGISPAIRHALFAETKLGPAMTATRKQSGGWLLKWSCGARPISIALAPRRLTCLAPTKNGHSDVLSSRARFCPRFSGGDAEPVDQSNLNTMLEALCVLDLDVSHITCVRLSDPRLGRVVENLIQSFDAHTLTV